MTQARGRTGQAWVGLALVLGVSTAACPDDSGSRRCSGNEQRLCACDGNPAGGTQSCDDYGNWSVCLCDDTAPASGDAGAGDSSRDSDIGSSAPRDGAMDLPHQVPAGCVLEGTYLVSGTVSVCSGCEWEPFTNEPFSVRLTSEGAWLTFDGFSHGPLAYGSSDRCLIHGVDWWSREDYVQGADSSSGAGTYHLVVDGDNLEGVYSWVVSLYRNGQVTAADCQVTYRVTGVRQ